ncbi:hypothetical protein DAPPUDRAFT_300905 [Daphnia pulex]|uniref:NADH dehydrogenase [ubiquinone] 1 alpha subcomplex subunit 7 n=1 Tax=Daphnia pulex TaxID=6669 RepID=E9HFD5_DAPPU|nr:hypothetical protein DAPPUDRAFT_300905 [Daphnia pulex]|eukprot:EFX69552.1 hypothetical protein DAPPUDRAFT_300905 [Daphnia pulex]
MSKVPLRDVTPLLYSIRAFLLGRTHKSQLRSANEMASHDQPPPNLPDGPYQKLSASYYYTHDARREMQPPTLVAVNSKNSLKLPPKADSKESSVAVKKPVAPGKVFHWD